MRMFEWKDNLKESGRHRTTTDYGDACIHDVSAGGEQRFCWIVHRKVYLDGGDGLVHGTTKSFEEAVCCAEKCLVLPINYFRQAVAAELLNDMRRMRRQALELAPVFASRV